MSTKTVHTVYARPQPAAHGTGEPTPDQAPRPAPTSTGKAAADHRPAPNQFPGERNGPHGPEPTRYGDWEKGGRCSDF